MPTARVQTPDGRIMTLQVPDGATTQQIQEFASQQFSNLPTLEAQNGVTSTIDSGGDIVGDDTGQPVLRSESPRSRSRRVSRLGQQQEPVDQLPEIGNAPELNELSLPAFKASFGLLFAGNEEGAEGILREQFPNATFGVSEAGERTVNLPSGTFRVRGPAQATAGVVAQTLPFLGAGAGIQAITKGTGALTKIGSQALGAGGVQAALEQGEEALGGEEADLSDVALAGAFGGGGQILGEAVGAGVRAFKGRAASEVVEAGKKAGVPVLTSDVIPPKGIIGGLARQTGERIPIAGTGGVRAAQQEARERAVAEFAESIPKASPADIISSLKTQSSKVKNAAGSRIEAVTTRMDETGALNIDDTISTINRVIDDLSKAGKIKDPETVKQLKVVKDTLLEAPQTFGMLRENRTAIRELIENADPAIRSQLPSKSKALVGKIKDSITRILDNTVENAEGASGLSRYKKADFIYANEAKKLTKSRLKNVLDKGDITPESVETLLFSRKPSEIKLLHDSLSSTGKAAARSSLIQRAIQKAGGIDDLSPTKFANELKRLQSSTDVFFKGASKKQIVGFRKLIEATKRAQEAKVVTPTGQSLTALAGVGAGSQVGLIPTLAAATTSGAAARIYESKPVRDLLLRLADVPVGSTAFDRAIATATPLITGALQSIRQEDRK